MQRKQNYASNILTANVALFLGGSVVGCSRLDLFDPVCSLAGEATFVLWIVLVEAIATPDKKCNFSFNLQQPHR